MNPALETQAAAARKAVAAIDPFAEDDSEPTIEQTSATGAQKRSPAASTVFETGSRVREVVQKAEDDLANVADLPEWAIEEGATQAKIAAKQATQTASRRKLRPTPIKSFGAPNRSAMNSKRR